MGMFTTITAPDFPEGIQIKCGFDDCDTYALGDTVDAWPSEHRLGQGKLGDDVYQGVVDDPTGLLSVWVVIKNQKVHHIHRRVALERAQYAENLQIKRDLRKEYGVYGWPHACWPEETWEKHYADRQKAKESAQVKSQTAPMQTDKEAAISAGANMIKAMMGRPSLMEQILSPTPIKEDTND